MASGASQLVMTAAHLDDTEDASNVTGSALKRPVRLTAMDGDAPQLAEAATLMPKGWTNELVGSIVICPAAAFRVSTLRKFAMVLTYSQVWQQQLAT